ncbi:hypothetical protein BDU57DRAFT_588168 [Ampelomyces quisqualis]|uniref:Zn(2)-C6 fungal-type domain-containing protein n=1 Tax=Ampelomyces quisqualis TaxID=50730 RepID=A0A6A5QKA0_AMPQU|nr:hypothetical protein BDU57DRAFT_588168 [Ampelomyces quisqualis]
MQSLVLPRPISFLPTLPGHPTELEDGLAKLPSRFSPSRSEHQSYPSPPMSEPHSPSRRFTQISDPSRHSNQVPGLPPQRLEAGLPLPPLSSAPHDPRSSLPTYGNSQPRQLYSAVPQARTQSNPYVPRPAPPPSPYGDVQNLPPNYTHCNQPTGGPQYGYSGPIGQQATMIAPPPLRPTKPARRTKAHVASACVNCKKAHLSCDVQRPCGRCVASEKQDTCKDVQHKKRGRPRLRDDRDFSRNEGGHQPSQVLGAVPASDAPSYPYAGIDAQQTVDPPQYTSRYREEHDPVAGSQQTLLSIGGQPNRAGAIKTGPYQNIAYQPLSVAFLNLDLVIQKSNQAFRELVSFLGDVRGKHLSDLLEAGQGESLQRLRNELLVERDQREPTYMAPITPIGQDPWRSTMDQITYNDADKVSRGFSDRRISFSFRTPNGQFQSLQARVRLAKTSLYFVTLSVRSPPVPVGPRPLGPPLLTQQLGPPTPGHTSQTMSAPTTAPVRDLTPRHPRPPSSTSSAPSSPYFNFSSVRTSLPTFSPSSYGSSSSYGYSPTSGGEPGYFPSVQHAAHPSTIYPPPYAVPPVRNPSITSDPLRELNRPARLEGLHLPPIRTGPAPLGSPLQMGRQSVTERVRRRASSPHAAEGQASATPETGKRRRLNIQEVLE